MTDEHKLGAYSAARVSNGIVFTAGQIGQDESGSRPDAFADEVRAAIASLETTLQEHGSTLGGLLQVHCILSDMSLFEEFNQIYSEMVPMPFPPRFTHSGGLVENFRIEIVGIAEAH